MAFDCQSPDGIGYSLSIHPEDSGTGFVLCLILRNNWKTGAEMPGGTRLQGGGFLSGFGSCSNLI